MHVYRIRSLRLVGYAAATLAVLAGCKRSQPYVALDRYGVTLHSGDTTRIHAVFGYTSGNPLSADRDVRSTSWTHPDAFRFTSSDTAVAQVDERALVRAGHPGVARIEVESGGTRADRPFTVQVATPAAPGSAP